MLRHNKHTWLVALWVKLREKSYNRSITAIYTVKPRSLKK